MLGERFVLKRTGSRIRLSVNKVKLKKIVYSILRIQLYTVATGRFIIR